MQTSLPRFSHIKPSHWLAVGAFALAIHGVLFASYSAPNKDAGAIPPEENGIKISLKKLSPPPAPVIAHKEVSAKPKPRPTAKPNTKPVTKAQPSKPTIKDKAKPVIAKKSPAVIKPATPEAIPKHTTSATDELVADNSSLSSSKETSAVNSSSSSDGAVTPSRGDPAVKASYEAALLIWLERFKRYPSAARRRGQQDVVKIQFSINKNGKVLSQKIVGKSPYNSLNKAVERMVKSASPVPPVPKEMQENKEQFTFIVPVAFRLN